MITHRLKAVRHADQILVVEIKDKSSNKEHLMNLMERDGIYASLHQWTKAGSRLEIAESFPSASLNKKPTKGTATVYRVGFLFLF